MFLEEEDVEKYYKEVYADLELDEDGVPYYCYLKSVEEEEAGLFKIKLHKSNYDYHLENSVEKTRANAYCYVKANSEGEALDKFYQGKVHIQSINNEGEYFQRELHNAKRYSRRVSGYTIFEK